MICVFPAVLYLFVEWCAHFFEEGDEPNRDVRSLHISLAPVVKITPLLSLPVLAVLLLFAYHDTCSFAAVQHWLVLHLCSRTAACAFATEVPVLHWYSSRVLPSCCSFHSLAVTHFVYSDPCLNHGSDQAITFWLFHISLRPVFLLCSPLVPNFNWVSDHVSPFLLSQAVCLWVPNQRILCRRQVQPGFIPVLILTACFSLYSLAGPFCLVHTPAKIFVIPWARCQSAFVMDFFKPRFGKSFMKSHTNFLIHIFCIEDPLIFFFPTI